MVLPKLPFILHGGPCGTKNGAQSLDWPKVKVQEPIPNSLSFKQLFMAFIETYLKNIWLLKIKSAIGPLSIIGASTLCVARFLNMHQIASSSFEVGFLLNTRTLYLEAQMWTYM
jgi:hypothetical protein